MEKRLLGLIRLSGIVPVAAISFFLVLLGITTVNAVAPPRPGQPYAESICSTDPNIILCEDFNYSTNFGSTWNNPGLKTQRSANGTGAITISPVTNYPAQPSGSPAGGFVKRINVANGEGETAGCLWGDCERSTDDNPTGKTYANGTPISNDLYIRFQILFSTDYKWPAFDNKIFFMWPQYYVDKPSAQIDAGMFFGNGVFCPTINRNFNDALSFRVGDNSGNFKLYPADANSGGFNEHPEYCNGEGYGNNSPSVSTTTPPNDTPFPGTLFRFQKGKWYTIEFRYKLSSPGIENGTIEAWVNGVKVYSDNDLATCGSGPSSRCAAINEISQYCWYNSFQEGGGLQGYCAVDNLIISKAYIGPPSSVGTVTSSAPVAPSNLTIQ